MTNFTVARYTDKTELPIQDGRLLVEKTHGLISVDVGDSRIPAQYVYGTIKSISTNNWISIGDRYYIDVTELIADELPYGHTVVGASLLSGSYSNTLVKNSSVRIYSNDRVTGSILVFALPGSGHSTDSSNYALSSLFHFEELDGAPVNCSGDASITQNTGWSYNTEYKYGYGSIIKSSVGYLEITGLQPLDSFTIEWWQYDTNATGDGGVILTSAGGTIECPPVAVTSSRYVSNAWKHFALVRKSGSSVRVYLNGNLIGFSSLTGTVDSPIKFYGSQAVDGSSKVCYIDELAIFNYAKYTEDFDVQKDPYVGDNEVLISVSTDNIFVDTIGQEITIDIPVGTATGDIPALDTSSFGADIDITNIEGTRIKVVVNESAKGSYRIVARYPGSISKVVYLNIDNPNAATADTIQVDSDTYALNNEDTGRAWDIVDPQSEDSAISVSSGEDTDVFVIENESTQGADRIWSE